MPTKRHSRTVLVLFSTFVVLLAGCTQPIGRTAPNTAPTTQPTPPTSSPVTTSNTDPLTFSRTDLLTGKDVNFPADSDGRVAVLLFFSTG